MRFDKETRAAIHDAAPGSVTIRWPTGQGQPEKGRVYRMQAAEEVKAAKRRLEDAPERHADVMAQMHKRQHGTWPEGYKPPKVKLRRPSKEDPCIKVLEVEPVGKRGWEATVALFEPAEPASRHTGLKTKVPAGPHPIAGHHEKVETEPAEIVVAPSRSEREDDEEALAIEHKASVDNAEIARAARKLANERKRGRRGTLAAAALERAKRRELQPEAA